MKYESALWPSCAYHDSQMEVEDSFYTEGPNLLPGAPMTQPSQEILSLPSKHVTTDVSWTPRNLFA